jgi:hypothetical protein
MASAVMSESALTFLPEGSLTIKVERIFAASAVSAAENAPANLPAKTRFVLFSEAWIKLQVFIESAMKLPITKDDFEAQYGTFEKAYKDKVDDVVSAMSEVNALSKTFGSPKVILEGLARDSRYVNDGDKKEIYAHIIWLANEIHSKAILFKYTSAGLAKSIGPSAGTVEQRRKNLTDILEGNDGLISQARRMVVLTEQLRSRLEAFGGELSRSTEALAEFTKVPEGKDKAGKEYKESILAKVESIIGDLNTQIETDMKKAEEANAKWRDYTIAASSVSGGLLLITGGLALPIVAAIGAGLGAEAQKQKNRYNELMRKISSGNLDLQKKSKLKIDLTGFGTQIEAIKNSVPKFLEQLKTIEDAWKSTKSKFENMAKENELKKVIDTPWLEQKGSIEAAQEEWGNIAEATKDFTRNSLIQFDLSVQFGQQAP